MHILPDVKMEQYNYHLLAARLFGELLAMYALVVLTLKVCPARADLRANFRDSGGESANDERRVP